MGEVSIVTPALISGVCIGGLIVRKHYYKNFVDVKKQELSSSAKPAVKQTLAEKCPRCGSGVKQYANGERYCYCCGIRFVKSQSAIKKDAMKRAVADAKANASKQKQNVEIETDIIEGHFATYIMPYVEITNLQYKKIKAKYSKYKEIVLEKQNSNDAANDEFMKNWEEMYISLMKNITAIKDEVDKANSIDNDYIKNQRYHFENSNLSVAQQIREKEKSKDREINKIKKLLAENEEIMTELDRSIIRISEMKDTGERDIINLRSEVNEILREVNEYVAI